MKSKSILIVVSDHDTRVRFRLALEVMEYKVYSAPSGSEALNLLKIIEVPQLIIFDKQLLLMSGEDFLKILKQNQEYHSIPILALSPERNFTELMNTVDVLVSTKKENDFN